MTFAMPTQGRNRVPAITADFWLIKLMAVTMGETAADYLAVNLGFGLTATSLIMTAVLIGALVLQFAQKRYVPWAYWLAVVLISIVGTLVTDNLVDTFGVLAMSLSVRFLPDQPLLDRVPHRDGVLPDAPVARHNRNECWVRFNRFNGGQVNGVRLHRCEHFCDTC